MKALLSSAIARSLRCLHQNPLMSPPMVIVGEELISVGLQFLQTLTLTNVTGQRHESVRSEQDNPERSFHRLA